MKRLLLLLLVVILVSVPSLSIIAQSGEQLPSIPALDAAFDFFAGDSYSWNGYLTYCSGFSAKYVEALGIELGSLTSSPNGYQAQVGDLFPDTNVLAQAKWILTNAPAYSWQIDQDLMDDPSTYEDIPIGSIIYFQHGGLSQNGTDTYYHVAVSRGVVNGVPFLADFARGMNNGPMNRPLEQTWRGMFPYTSMLEPTEHEHLYALVFDVLGYADSLRQPTPTPTSSITPISWSAQSTQGGPIAPQLQFDGVVIVLNINDGTTTVWRSTPTGYIQLPVDDQGSMEAYAVVGRLLKVNPEITDLYASSRFAQDGSYYDGEHGVLYDSLGIARTTYTRYGVFSLEEGFYDTPGFGGLQGHSDIGLLKALYRQNDQIVTYDLHSHYTIHRVPQGTDDQEILLREPDLVLANTPGVTFGPLSYPTLNRSSGCVNYDAQTWIELKNVIQPYLNEDIGVYVIFTTPSIDQNLLLNVDPFMGNDPMSNRNVKEWGYDNIRDLRGYYQPQPQT